MWYNIESSFVCLFVCSRVVVFFVVQLPEVSEKQILTIEIQADWHFISFIFIFYFFFFHLASSYQGAHKAFISDNRPLHKLL